MGMIIIASYVIRFKNAASYYATLSYVFVFGCKPIFSFILRFEDVK